MTRDGFTGLALLAWMVAVAVLATQGRWALALLLGLGTPTLYFGGAYLAGWVEWREHQRAVARDDAEDAAQAAPLTADDPGAFAATLRAVWRLPAPRRAGRTSGRWTR